MSLCIFPFLKEEVFEHSITVAKINKLVMIEKKITTDLWSSKVSERQSQNNTSEQVMAMICSQANFIGRVFGVTLRNPTKQWRGKISPNVTWIRKTERERHWILEMKEWRTMKNRPTLEDCWHHVFWELNESTQWQWEVWREEHVHRRVPWH
jgi:hypothetical protein